jgi:hypothetical protein
MKVNLVGRGGWSAVQGRPIQLLGGRSLPGCPSGGWGVGFERTSGELARDTLYGGPIPGDRQLFAVTWLFASFLLFLGSSRF